MLHTKVPSAVEREFEIDSEETLVSHECKSNEKKVTPGQGM